MGVNSATLKKYPEPGMAVTGARFKTPQDTPGYLTTTRVRETMDFVTQFAFKQGVLGAGAASPDVIGISAGYTVSTVSSPRDPSSMAAASTMTPPTISNNCTCVCMMIAVDATATTSSATMIMEDRPASN